MADPLASDTESAEPAPVRLVARLIVGGAALIVGLLLAVASYQLYGALRTENGLTTRAHREWVAAKAEHAGIIAIASQCEGTSFTHPLTVPATLTTIVPDAWRGPAPPEPGPALTLDAPSYLLAAVILSNDIGRARIEIAGDAARDNVWMQLFEWAMVSVGAVTTVLVSLKSITAVRQGALTVVGVGAIVFSALGTSIAAVNSFYSPRTTYEHDQHVLADLRNLHLQLATGIAREGNLCSAWRQWSKDWRFVRIKALADQYAAITDASRTGALPTEGDPGTSDTPPGVASAANGTP